MTPKSQPILRNPNTGRMSPRRKTGQPDPVPQVQVGTSARTTRSQSSSRREIKDHAVSKLTTMTDAIEACTEEHCRFGCVCGSLRSSNTKRGKHCGKPECMIVCKCTIVETSQSEEVTPRRPRQIPARFRDGDVVVSTPLRSWKEAKKGLAVAVKRTAPCPPSASGNSKPNGSENGEMTRTVVDTDSNNRARLVRIPVKDFDMMKWHSVVFIDKMKLPENVKVYCMEHDIRGCPCVAENPPPKPVTIKPPRTSHRARLVANVPKENEPSVGRDVSGGAKTTAAGDSEAMQQHYWQRVESKFGTLLKDGSLLQELMVQEKLFPVDKDLDLTVHERCWRLVSWSRFHELFNEGKFRIRILKRRRGSIVLVMRSSEILASDITVDIRELRGEPDTPTFLRELLEPLTESNAKQYAAIYCDGIKWELLGCISVPSIASVERVSATKSMSAASLPRTTTVEKQSPALVVSQKRRPDKRKSSASVQPSNKKVRVSLSARMNRKPATSSSQRKLSLEAGSRPVTSLVEVDMTQKTATESTENPERSPIRTDTAVRVDKPVLTKASVMSMLEQARKQLSQSLTKPLPQLLQQDKRANQDSVSAPVFAGSESNPVTPEGEGNSDSLELTEHSYSLQPGTFPHLFSKSILPLISQTARSVSPTTPVRVIEVPMTSESPPPKSVETAVASPQGFPFHSLVSPKDPVPYVRFPLAECVTLQNFRSGESALRKRLKIQFAGPKETVICLPLESDDDQWYILEMGAVPAQGIVVPPKNMCIPRVVFLSALTRALSKPFRAEIQLRTGFEPDPSVRPGFGVIAFPQFRQHVFLGPFSKDILKHRFEGGSCMLNVNKLQMRPILPRITRILTATGRSAASPNREQSGPMISKASGGELNVENEDTKSATSCTSDVDPTNLTDLTDFDFRAMALEALNQSQLFENTTEEKLVVDVAPDVVPGISSQGHAKNSRGTRVKWSPTTGFDNIFDSSSVQKPFERTPTAQLQHLHAERQRRRLMLGLFQELADLIPDPAEPTFKTGYPSRQSILDKAVQVIHELKEQSEQLASEYAFALRERAFYMEIIETKAKVLPKTYREVVSSLLSKLQTCVPVTFDRPSVAPRKRTILLDGQGKDQGDRDALYEYDTESASSTECDLEIDILK